MALWMLNFGVLAFANPSPQQWTNRDVPIRVHNALAGEMSAHSNSETTVMTARTWKYESAAARE